MKSDVILYEKIYRKLKYQIACGILAEGQKLPSRAEMCKEFHTSEQPVRCALEMLAKEGLIITEKRKRPVVAGNVKFLHNVAECSVRKAESIPADDLVRTAIILSYPLIVHGISLCEDKDWMIPEKIVNLMDPKDMEDFWHLSNSVWRFFIARNNNELILRTVDSMNVSRIYSSLDSYEKRDSYYRMTKALINAMKEGKNPTSIEFGDISLVYTNLKCDEHLEEKLRKGEERHSSVCLDILGLIDIGVYQPGERLPSHKELQDFYGVSIDTTLRAIKTLKEWGVVKTAPKKGIVVAMDLSDIKKIRISPKMIAKHVRRFLDSLEFLELTIETVTLHAMREVKKEDIDKLLAKLYEQWQDPRVFHFFPSTLLEFITDHIRYETLRAVYEVMRKNFRVGRSIPKLIVKDKTEGDHQDYQKSLTAVAKLYDGDTRAFASIMGELFKDIRSQVIAACIAFGYYEDAIKVYDGRTLWQ